MRCVPVLLAVLLTAHAGQQPAEDLTGHLGRRSCGLALCAQCAAPTGKTAGEDTNAPLPKPSGGVSPARLGRTNTDAGRTAADSGEFRHANRRRAGR